VNGTLTIRTKKEDQLGSQAGAYRAAAEVGRLAGVPEYSEDDLVSTDIVGSSASCIFDSKLTMANGNLVKVLGWYDNETGYSSRLVDLANVLGRPLES
jgi:glyceraldehyde 3-phosphate dehydrogenase